MPVSRRGTGETRGAGQRGRRDTRLHRRRILTRTRGREVTLHRRFGYRARLERGAGRRAIWTGRRVAASRSLWNVRERFRGVERVERGGQWRSLPVVPLPRVLPNTSPRVGQIERALRPVPEERDPLFLAAMPLVAAHILRRLVLGQPPVSRGRGDHARVREEGAVQAALGREHGDLVPDGSFGFVVLPPQFSVQREFSGRRVQDRGVPRRVRGGATVDLGRACERKHERIRKHRSRQGNIIEGAMERGWEILPVSGSGGGVSSFSAWRSSSIAVATSL